MTTLLICGAVLTLIFLVSVPIAFVYVLTDLRLCRLHVEKIFRALPPGPCARNELMTNDSAAPDNSIEITPTLPSPLVSEGQAIVEFTIAIILFIVIAWIPVDFGLAFYTGQIAQNAAREGARIAAADSTLVVGNSSCSMPGCYTFGNIFNQTAARLPAALLTGTSITVQYPAPGSAATCNRRVLVRVQGEYNFFFYRVLGFLGTPVPTTVTINRTTEMRWEHQSGCVGGAIP